MAPLGVPVVPPVYCKTARSLTASTVTRGTAGGVLSRPVNLRAPAGIAALGIFLSSLPMNFLRGLRPARSTILVPMRCWTLVWESTLAAAGKTESSTTKALAPESISWCLISRGL